METVYFYCAAIGGGLLVLQVLLLLFAGDAEFDTDASPEMDAGDIDASKVLLQLSLKTVIAFVTFFGLAGMACTRGDIGSGATLGIAGITGFAAFMMVGYVMQSLMALQSKGNVDLRTAIGQTGKVDLRIPANQSGAGKVAVIVGSRLRTLRAVTKGDAIPTGTEVDIVAMTSPNTFQVSSKQ